MRAFEGAIRRELNLDYGRLDAQRISENLKRSPHIYIPRVYRELSTERVLTLEFIAGEKLSSFRPEELGEGRGEEVASSLMLALVQQIFEDGVYHADPHPGNLIL